MIWTIYDLCSRYTLDTIMTITIMSPIHICHWTYFPNHPLQTKRCPPACQLLTHSIQFCVVTCTFQYILSVVLQLCGGICRCKQKQKKVLVHGSYAIKCDQCITMVSYSHVLPTCCATSHILCSMATLQAQLALSHPHSTKRLSHWHTASERHE